MKRSRILSIVVLGVAILVGFVLFQQNNQDTDQTTTPSPTTVASPPSPTITVEAPSDWEVYTSSQHGFSIRHPQDLEISEHPQGGITFTRIGPTQTEGTELFDGFNISIRQDTYTQTTLEQLVQDEYQEVQEEPITEILSEIRSTTVGGNQGYTFRIRGLGEFDYYYLPSGNQEYLFISTMIADPENLGYEDTVMQMFSTLQIQ